MDKLMKIFGKLLPKMAKKLVVSKKDVILANMNKKLNLPLLDEEDELQLLEGIWSCVEEALGEAEK